MLTAVAVDDRQRGQHESRKINEALVSLYTCSVPRQAPTSSQTEPVVLMRLMERLPT